MIDRKLVLVAIYMNVTSARKASPSTVPHRGTSCLSLDRGFRILLQSTTNNSTLDIFCCAHSEPVTYAIEPLICWTTQESLARSVQDSRSLTYCTLAVRNRGLELGTDPPKLHGAILETVRRTITTSNQSRGVSGFAS